VAGIYDLAMSLAVGQVFAGYTILRVLGAGAMGTVYLAKHPRLPREDALKVLPAELTANPEFRARVVRDPLPQPLQNPITLLTGNGHQQQSEPCAVSVDFDETFTRTGD
jgi:serine/threonine protein kinase